MVDSDKSKGIEEAATDFLVTYRGRYLYECCHCGASNGEDLNNVPATQRLIGCGGCDAGIGVFEAVEKWRAYRESNPQFEIKRKRQLI